MIRWGRRQGGRQQRRGCEEPKAISARSRLPKIDLAIDDEQRRLTAVTKELGELRQNEVLPEVDHAREAQSRLRSIKSELKDLQNAKAQIPVKADTSQAERRDREPRQRGR